MRPTGGVRRYAIELEKAIATFGTSERVGLELGERVGRIAGRRVGGSIARLSVDGHAHALSRRADLVHSAYYDCSMLGRKLPLIVSFHDCIHERFSVTGKFRSSVLARDKRLSVERARFVLAISTSTANDASEFYGLDGDRSIVVHPPLSDAFTRSVEQLEFSSVGSSRYFLYVGPRAGYKNWSLLVRAVGSIPRAMGAVRLVSVGGGPLTPDERLTLVEAGVSADSHTWIERLTDGELACAYRNALALVCPSDFEGFGYPVAEAICSGGRAIASDGGSLPEFQKFGCTVFPVGDMDALRNSIVELVQNPHLPIDNSKRSLAISSLGRDAFTRSLQSIYGKAL